MATGFFGDLQPVRYEGAVSENPLAYRHYDASRIVLGKTMAEHLRPAICYWHNFAWPGSDMFGAPTFDRPWFAETMAAARLKADVAFEMFALLGTPFFTFHDRDVVPEGASLQEFGRNLAEITRQADILIAAIGRPGFVKAGHVREGAVVIDVGINRVEDPSREKGYRIVGDVAFEEVAPKCSLITPVPGGVGPMTIAMLMANTVKACRQITGA